jgi:hypothetical protein
MQENALTKVNTGDVATATNELQNLGSELNGKTAFLQRKEMMLAEHIEKIARTNRTWLQRLQLPKEEKMMLQEYAEKQQEAVGVILTNQNKSLHAICEGQVTFVKEVVNTLLKTGRAGLKAGADVLFAQLRNQRTDELQKLSSEFYDLMEIKMADAEKRPSRLQEMKLREIEIDLVKWEADYEQLQNEFSSILQEQV